MNRYKLCKIVVSIVCSVLPIAIVYLFANDILNFVNYIYSITIPIFLNPIGGFISGILGPVCIIYLFRLDSKESTTEPPLTHVIPLIACGVSLGFACAISAMYNKNIWICSSMFITIATSIIYASGAFGVCKFLKRGENE